MSKYYSEEINQEAFIKNFDPVVEGYICVKTPILSEEPINYYEHLAYQHIKQKPIIDKFISARGGGDWVAWLDKKVAYENFKYYRDFYWSSGIKTTSWSVVKVSLDRELISRVFRQLKYYQGREWPLVVTCHDVYCLEYVYYGIGCRPDITESEEAIEKWNKASFEKTDSKKAIFNKKKS